MRQLHDTARVVVRCCFCISLQCGQLLFGLPAVDRNVARSFDVSAINNNVAGDEQSTRVVVPAPAGVEGFQLRRGTGVFVRKTFDDHSSLCIHVLIYTYKPSVMAALTMRLGSLSPQGSVNSWHRRSVVIFDWNVSHGKIN